MVYLFLFFINFYLSFSQEIKKYEIHTDTNYIIDYKTFGEINDNYDLAFIFEPFYKEYFFGKMYISDDIPFNKINDLNSLSFVNISSDKIISYSFSFLKKVDTIYLNFMGYFYGTLMIIDLNQIISLNIYQNYYFTYIKLYKKKFITFKIENPEKNIFMNLIPYKNNCSGLIIYENNELIPCNNEISNYIYLKSNNKYYIEFYPDIIYFLGINFFDNLIVPLDKEINDIITLNSFVFSFILEIKEYNINNRIPIIIDSKSRFTINGGFLIEDIDRNNINNDQILLSESFTQEDCKYYILNKTNREYNYVLFDIKVYSNEGEKFKIKIIDSIVEINDFQFKYNLTENNNYLFIIEEKFKSKFIYLKSLIFLSYEKENKMNTIIYNREEYCKQKYLFLNIKNIEGIYFDKGENGVFIFKFVNQSFSFLLKDINYNQYNQALYLNSNNIFSFIPIYNNYYIYFNLIAGNANFNLFNNFEKVIPSNNNNSNELSKKINNETTFLYSKINYPSMIEYFYEIEHSFYYIINNTQIILLRDNINHTLLMEKGDMVLIKLLTGKSANIYYGNQKYILDKNNKKIKIIFNKYYTIIGNGENVLLHLFLPITNNSEYQIINNCEICELNNVDKFFIKPNYKDYNSMIFHIFIENGENDDHIPGFYLLDFNLIPFSRDKDNVAKDINLKYNFNNTILLNNIIQNDISVHNDDESLFIYFEFERKIKKIHINVEFIDIIYPNNLEPILIKKGNSKIFLGKHSINYVLIDQCANSNNSIKYSFIQNEIESSKQIIDGNEKFINLSNYSENLTFLEINCQEELLLFLSSEEFELFDGFILNYDITFYYDEDKIYINFDSIASANQVEYLIVIIEKKGSINLNNHCEIKSLLDREEYIYKETIFSNEDEAFLYKEIDYNKILKINQEYILIILVKEYDNYNLYKFYNPKEFELSFEYMEIKGDPDGTEESYESKEKINIAVIIVPIVIIIAIAIIVVFIYFRNKKRKKDENKIEAIKIN